MVMQFVRNVARKSGQSSLLAVEAAKTRLARQIGASSGLFYVPKVVSFDSEVGVLEFERIDGLITLRELAMRKDVRLYPLLKKAGHSLAIVHAQLFLPGEIKHELPPEWMGGSEENVFIHGDFNLCNVCFREDLDQLVILDWSAAPLLGGTPVFGSRYFDILWFVSHAFISAPNRRLFRWDSKGIADALIEGYARAIQPNTVDKLRIYWPRLLQLHRRSVWHIASRQKLCRACVWMVSQSFLYCKLWRYGRRFY